MYVLTGNREETFIFNFLTCRDKNNPAQTTKNMTDIFKIKFVPNYVRVKEQVWNGRDSDELQGYDTVTETIQRGWEVQLYQSSFDWEETEKEFKLKLNQIEELSRTLKDSIFNFDFNFKIPYSVEIPLENNSFKLIERLVINNEDCIEEEVYFQKRVGMSTNYLFSDKALLSAPVKSNNKSGATLRGYACSLVINSDLQKDEDFYLEILENFNTENLR